MVRPTDSFTIIKVYNEKKNPKSLKIAINRSHKQNSNIEHIKSLDLYKEKLDVIVLSRTQLTSPTPFHYISHTDRHNAERQTYSY